MKIPRPPRPLGPPLPPPLPIKRTSFPRNNIGINHLLDDQKIELERELLYNNFMHSYVLNFYAFNEQIENNMNVNTQTKCNLIDINSLNYLYLNEDSESVSKRIKVITNTDNEITNLNKNNINSMLEFDFVLPGYNNNNRTKAKVKSISVYNNKKFKNLQQLQIQNQTILKLINTTTSTQNIHSTTNTMFTPRNGTQSSGVYFDDNFTRANYKTIKHNMHNSHTHRNNSEDLFDQMYSNPAIFLYKMLLIPSAILIFVFVLACLVVMAKNYKTKPNKKLSSSSTSSFIACYGTNTLVSSSIEINNTNISTILTNSPKTSRLKNSTKLNATSNSLLSSSSSNDMNNDGNVATISNYYSMCNEINSGLATSHMSANISKTENINNETINPKSNFKNYEIYSNYPQVYSLSTFGRNDENLNGIVPIKNNYNNNSKNSCLSKMNSFAGNHHIVQKDVTFIVNKPELKVFPRTNPLCSRNNGNRCKTPDTNVKSKNEKLLNLMPEIEFDVCSKL